MQNDRPTDQKGLIFTLKTVLMGKIEGDFRVPGQGPLSWEDKNQECVMMVEGWYIYCQIKIISNREFTRGAVC